MVAWISSWAEGIIVAVIIATILEMILPDGKNKKYVKTVIGLFVLFTIISPIISKFANININLNSKDYEKYFNTVQCSSNSNLLYKNNSEDINKIYLTNIKDDITQKLKDKGYNAENIELEINTNDNNYGSIKQINLNINKKNNDNNDNSVQEINRIKIENKKSTIDKKEALSQDEKEEITNYLNETYNIEKKNIIIKN